MPNFKIYSFKKNFSDGVKLFKTVLGQLPPRKIAPLTPKLTLTQPLTLTGGQLSKGAIVWLPPNPKTKPNLDPKPIPNRGATFLGEQLSRYQFKQN